MQVSTTEEIPGAKIESAIGVVKGNKVKAKWFGADFLSRLRNIFGGELKEYSGMLTQTREEAYGAMLEEAESLGADAVVNVRFATSQIAKDAAEVLAYGTAVKLKREK